MKRFLCLSLAAIFAVGVLFPVSRTSEGKSHFVQQIKRLFNFSDGTTGREGAKVKKGPVLHGEGGSPLFQDIKNAFHYFPEEKKRPNVKQYPPKFDKAVKRELRYPHGQEVK